MIVIRPEVCAALLNGLETTGDRKMWHIGGYAAKKSGKRPYFTPKMCFLGDVGAP